ncbi:MAG: VTT domain-containing protein [Myxococcota bacterium]
MKRYLPISLAALVVAAIFAGSAVRDQLGIHYAPESLQAYFTGLGSLAPVVFVAIMAFRSLLLLPSMLVLTVGGLVFGAPLGTVLGALGIAISGSMMFFIARAIGRDWVRHRLGDRFQGLEEKVEVMGPVVIGLTTAHPMGPMSPFHWAAGVSSIRAERFLVALGLGGLVRAGACAYFGSTLLNIGSRDFYLSTSLMLAMVVLPLLHPGLRKKIFAGRLETASPRTKPESAGSDQASVPEPSLRVQ